MQLIKWGYRGVYDKSAPLYYCESPLLVFSLLRKERNTSNWDSVVSLTI